jgi:hypothetical protein
MAKHYWEAAARSVDPGFASTEKITEALAAGKLW